MENSFIEVYDNALPSDICDYLMALFERENNSVDGKVRELRTLADTEQKTTYVSALEMILNSDSYIFDSVIADLDYTLIDKIFEYNKKYKVWSDDLNENLIPEEIESIDTAEKLNNFIYRLGNWSMKKYRHPEDGYNGWHTDWTKHPYFIQRVLSVQFYLNDVEKGGETEFYHQKLKIKPKKGSLVIWPVGFTHTHRGNKPISNDKYIISNFMTTYV